MSQALIGFTGFVGTNLLSHTHFDDTYASANIDSIRGKHFDRVVCAGISAVKWWANKNPDEDWAKIENLISNLRHVTADTFTLISTVDVYNRPVDVTEETQPDTTQLHPYGLHRLKFERFAREHFETVHVVRLPALFGRGLKKNAIFDLIHNNQTQAINPLGAFQWYPVERLHLDLEVVEKNKISTLNMATEPVSMKEIADMYFPDAVMGPSVEPAPRYDMHTIHASYFSETGPYVMRKNALLESLGNFIGQARQQ